MSYRRDVAPDAWADLRQFDIDVQEAVFDEIDRVGEAVELPNGAHALRYATVSRRGVRHHLVITVIINRTTNVLSVIGVVENPLN